MGHSSDEIATRNYHVSSGEKAAAVRKLHPD